MTFNCTSAYCTYLYLGAERHFKGGSPDIIYHLKPKSQAHACSVGGIIAPFSAPDPVKDPALVTLLLTVPLVQHKVAAM